MSRKSNAYKNVLSFQLSRVLNKVFGVLFLAVAARYLGTGGFGQWSLIFLFIGFFGLLADFGVDRLTVRDVARDIGSSRKYLVNTLIFKSISIVPVGILLIAVVHLANYPEDTTELFLFALPILVIGVLAAPFSSVIQAHEKIYVISYLDIFQGLIVSLAGIILLLLGQGIKSLLVMNIFFSVARFGILIYITNRILGGVWHPLNSGFVAGLVKKAFPFAILSILGLIHYKVDYFMISKLLGTEELGLYAAAYKVFDNIVMLGVAFNTALFPTISTLFRESKEKLRGVYEGLQKNFTILSLPLTILIFFFAKEIILLLYGDQYYESINIMMILSWAFGIIFFSIPMRLIINNSDLIIKLVPYSLATTSMNILLNFVMIPRYGIMGAAVVSLLSGTADVIIRLHFIRRIFSEGHHPRRVVVKPIIGAVIMILTILVFGGLNKYISAVIGLGAYIYFLYRTGEISRGDQWGFFVKPLEKLLSTIGRRK